MVRIVLGVIAGFIAWLIAWVGTEKIVSAIWPAFGTHQAAFQTAITDGGQFTADTTMLLTHIVMGSIISVMSGAVAALIAGGNSRAPLFVGILLLAMGIMKAVMSWQYVPVWYHVIFTAMLLPLAIVGG
ncbi:MAG TPA: hypothetical protein VGQ55_15105, partial [Pyrinomonadaceae bacterium]|nr:hypothetical protein [Pyrinomonadaceae bacterium]